MLLSERVVWQDLKSNVNGNWERLQHKTTWRKWHHTKFSKLCSRNQIEMLCKLQKQNPILIKEFNNLVQGCSSNKAAEALFPAPVRCSAYKFKLEGRRLEPLIKPINCSTFRQQFTSIKLVLAVLATPTLSGLLEWGKGSSWTGQSSALHLLKAGRGRGEGVPGERERVSELKAGVRTGASFSNRCY